MAVIQPAESSCGSRPENMLPCDGSVQGAVLKARSNATPRRANRSMLGVVGRA
jgi:hypothetical protein